MPIERLKLWEVRFGLGMNKRLTAERLIEGQCVDSVNFIVEHGDLRVRPGTSKLTSTSLQANKPIIGLKDFKKRDGRNFLLAACGNKLYVATGAGTAFNDLNIASKSNLPSWTANPTYPVEMEAFPIRDALHLANSAQDTAYRFDGTLLSNLDPIWPPTVLHKPHVVGGDLSGRVDLYRRVINEFSTPTIGAWSTASGQGTRWHPAIQGAQIGIPGQVSQFLRITATTSATAGDYARWNMTTVTGETKDWSLTDLVCFWVRASKSGTLFSIQISEDASTWFSYPVEIKEANKWQQVVWKIASIAETSRDHVLYVQFVCEKGLTAYTIDIDHLYLPGGLTLVAPYQYRFAYYDKTTGEISNTSEETRPETTTPPNEVIRVEGMGATQVYLPGTNDKCADGSTKLQVRLYRKGGAYESIYKRVPLTYLATSLGTTVASAQGSMTAPTAGTNRAVIDMTPDLRLGDEMPSPVGHPRFARFLKEFKGRMVWNHDHHESEANFGRWGAAVSAATERLTMTTINNEGPIVGVLVYPTTTGTLANLGIALDKKISGTFVEMRRANLRSSEITANKWHLRLWGTGVGDNYVKTTPTGTWRLRLQAATGSAMKLATSDGTKIAFRALRDVKNRLWITDRYEPEKLSAFNIYDDEVSDDQGGYIDLPIRAITALGKYGDDLLIFGDNRTYLLMGDSPQDFRWPCLSRRIGCTAPRSYVYAEEQAYWFGNGHFWTFDGQRLYAVDQPHGNGGSDIRPLLDALSSTYTPNIVGEYDPKYRYIYWSYTESGTTNNKVFVYDLKTNSFIRFAGIAAFRWRTRVAENDILFGDYGGRVWRYDRTDSKHQDDTSAISLSYESNHSDLNALDQEKKAAYFLVQGDGTTRSARHTFRLMLDGTAANSTASKDLQGTGMRFDRLTLSPETSRGRYVGVRITGTAATGTELTRIRHLGVYFQESAVQGAGSSK